MSTKLTDQEIEFIKEEIKRHHKHTPYGKGHTFPFLMLKEAIEMIEYQQGALGQIVLAESHSQARRIAIKCLGRRRNDEG